uniref:Uncharacterized protein n=1 Tax=Rhizophora mucronata TaxID=61149 RepID=A0A2P2QUY0_RHIMU
MRFKLTHGLIPITNDWSKKTIRFNLCQLVGTLASRRTPMTRSKIFIF